MRYINAELPKQPKSPLVESKHVLLARPWMKELIIGLHNGSLNGLILVLGNPGIGASWASSCLTKCLSLYVANI